MILTEIGTIPADTIPIRAFGEHLRLGTGFEDDGSQDSAMELYLRSAMAAIEARLGYALLSRQFSWTLTRWQQETSQGMPIGPISSIDEVVLVSVDESEVVVDPSQWHLLRDDRRPRLVGRDGGTLPAIPHLGHTEIRFTAGHGSTWDSVPHDLRQAVFMLAAYYFEARSEGANGHEAMPFGVLMLLESYRTMRLGGLRDR
ncbi:MAG: hypothetical protein AAGG56_16195 [Pseudomonadota bacterium]